jgi:tetratricopeptide (TPR) repeat protein
LRETERPNFDAVTSYLAQDRLVEASDRVRDISTRLPLHNDVKKLNADILSKAEKAVSKTRAESSDRYFAEGVVAYLKEDWFKAVASWEQVFKFNPTRLDVKAKVERARKNLQEQERRDRFLILLDVGREMTRQKLYLEAIKACTEAISLDQKNPEARACLEKARRGNIEEMARLRSEEVQRMLEQAMGHFTSGKRTEATRGFQSVLDKDPANRVASEYLNRIYGRDPGFQISDNPLSDGGAGNYRRGQQYLSEGRYDEANEAFERYLAARPDDAKAQQSLEDARAKQREAAENAYREGLTHWAQGDLVRAKDLWEKTLRIDPDYVKAKQALVKTKQEESRPR